MPSFGRLGAELGYPSECSIPAIHKHLKTGKQAPVSKLTAAEADQQIQTGLRQ